ncbi:MAG: metal-sensing transcriptional repressor [Deltaproteobacteria bacterium]|nr:metal-sensing transcriptional repressor [Deltaproteobacteria bacterium]
MTRNEDIIQGRLCMDDQTRADLADYLASVGEQLRFMRRSVEEGSCVSDLLDQAAAVRAALSTFADAIGRRENTSCGAACLNASARSRLQRVATALRSMQDRPPGAAGPTRPLMP